MRLGNLAKMFSLEDLGSDLFTGFAAGIVAALFTSAVRVWFHGYILPRSVIWYLVLGITTYTLVALLLNMFWKAWSRRIIPSWLMIGFIGSLVFVLARLTPGVIGGWYDPLRLEPTFAEYISTEISAAKDLLLLYWALTIPSAGFASLSVSIVKSLRRRRFDRPASCF